MIWLALGCGMAIEGVRLGVGKVQLPGTGFMPFAVGVALALCGLFMTTSTFVAKGEGAEDQVWAGQNWKNLFLPLLALLAFVLLLDPLGFLLVTFLLQFFLLKLSHPDRWTRPAALALSIAVVSWLVFSVWLKIPLPKGIWLDR